MFVLTKDRLSDFSECTGEGDRLPFDLNDSASEARDTPWILLSSLPLLAEALLSATDIDILSVPLATLVRFVITGFLSLP